MSGGPNNTKKPRTGAPPGFTHGGGASTMALVDYVNPTTGKKWTASSGGWQAPEGWEVDQGDTWRAVGDEMKMIPGKFHGQKFEEWKDPNAPPRLSIEEQLARQRPGGGGFGGWNPGGGGYGGWNPGGQMGGWNPGGQLSGLLGGGQQAIKYPSMNIPGLLQYHTIDN